MVDVGLVIGETESGKSLELSLRVVERARMELSAVILCILEGKVQNQPISFKPHVFSQRYRPVRRRFLDPDKNKEGSLSQAILGILPTYGHDSEAFIGSTTLGRAPLQHAFVHCIRCLILLQCRSNPAPAETKRTAACATWFLDILVLVCHK